MNRFCLTSRSPEDTRALAARLGGYLKPGDLIALKGELGAGKTEFVLGLAMGLGVPIEEVASPSFALAHHYEGRLSLVHLDLYRLTAGPEDFLPDLEEYLSGSQVTAVEWAERLGNLGPPEYLEVNLSITGETERQITFAGHGPRGEELVALILKDL
ncbi:MAG: tRNA (adenosine(37)-N6)-threonylcarbamoyltransferase complex ATPase subunit type 1 TsaE [Desulfobaccales bacterium]